MTLRPHQVLHGSAVPSGDVQVLYLEPYFDLPLCETQGVGDLDPSPASEVPGEEEGGEDDEQRDGYRSLPVKVELLL